MITFNLLTKMKIDIREIIFNDIVTRPTDTHRKKYVAYHSVSHFLLEKVGKKKKSQAVTRPKPKSQGPEALGVTPKATKRMKKTKTKSALIQTKLQLTKEKEPLEGTNTSQSVSTCYLLPKGTLTNPKDSWRNIQLTNIGFPSTLVTNQSWANTKYQENRTQSTLFELLDPDYNKDKTSSEEELDTIPAIQSLGYFEALMEDSEDDLKDFSDEEVFEAGDEMHMLLKNHPNFHLLTRIYDNFDNWEKHKEAIASYADLRAEIEEFHDEAYRTHANNDADLRNYEKILTAFKTLHLKGIDSILTNLNTGQEVIKEDHALNARLLKALEVYIKNSTNLTKLIDLLKDSDIPRSSSNYSQCLE
ncbi:hypothetical protein Tco_1191992 [Tanacetum coccineum]